MRETWDAYFMKMAKLASSRATCCRAKVGCVLVRHSRVIATGYNGSPPGQPHCTDVGCDLVHDHCVRCIHAEQNMVASAARMGISTNGGLLYIWSEERPFPCDICAKLLTVTGIKGIVVLLQQVDTSSRAYHILEDSNIPILYHQED